MIDYQSVTKIFGAGKTAFTALENITFSIPAGNVVVFLGPSGCGKTTLLRLTNRLEGITRGKILIQGRDVTEQNETRLRQSMGYVIQQIGLFPNKTIYGNVAIVPRLLGWDRDRIKKRVDELLEMVKLDPEIYRDRYPAELSGGQQQRIGVARALAADPDILLMDEPFGAIDPINREQIQDEFLKLQAKLKKTIAFVSHDIHEAIKMGDMIAIFKEGRLVQFDTPEILLTRPKNKFIADFVGADRTLKVLGLIRAKQAMNTRPVNLIPHDTPAPQALALMEEKRRTHGIVVREGKPVGYVTPKILKYEEGPVIDTAEDYPDFIGTRSPLRDVLSAMLMHNLSVMCVVDDNGDLVGTISYRNIQDHILEVYREGEDEE